MALFVILLSPDLFQVQIN